MFTTITYRLYPNEGQKRKIDETLRAATFCWNLATKMVIDRLEAGYKTFTTKPGFYYEKLYGWKREFPKLYDFNSSALNSVLFDFSRSVASLRNQLKAPQFRDPTLPKSDSYRTLYNDTWAFEINKQYLLIPSIGFVKAKITREIPGVVKRLTLKRTAEGHYYAELLIEKNSRVLFEHGPRFIGIDIGVKTFLTCSNGYRVENPECVEVAQQRIHRLEKKLERQAKGSKSWRATLRRINIEKNYIHRVWADLIEKVTTLFCRGCYAIAIEDIDIKTLASKQNSLASKILLNHWGAFVRRLMQKAKAYNVIVVKVGRYFPSTQTCSKCGRVNKDAAKLEVREWVCPCCGAKLDRDLNAAINIKKGGLILVEQKLKK